MYHVGVLFCKLICVAVPTRAGVGLGVAVFARAARPAANKVPSKWAKKWTAEAVTAVVA